MSILGLGSKTTEANGASLEKKSSITAQNGTSDDANKLAAAALVAARDAAATSAFTKGKIEVIIIIIHQMVNGFLMSKYCITSFLLLYSEFSFRCFLLLYLRWRSRRVFFWVLVVPFHECRLLALRRLEDNGSYNTVLTGH